jgi:hypothetical protein
MIFEAIPQNDGFFLLKDPRGKCLWASNFTPYVSVHVDCTPNEDNLWKNAFGQVYNKKGRALWWEGDKSNNFQ